MDRFEAGLQVRLKADVGRIGFCTGKVLERGEKKHIQVQFPNGPQYIPVDQLEIVSNIQEHPLDLLSAGKFAYVKDLRRVLAHVRLSGRLADLIYSMEVSNTDFYAYQFKPIIKILNTPNNGLLIADEVGLGKTIESGLIWTELKSRFDFKRLLVLCPAMLRDKWQAELYNRFGVKAQIMDADGVYRTLNQTSSIASSDSFAIIASHQGLRPRKDWDDADIESPSAILARFLKEQAHEEPLVDLLVIDEAHYFRNPETKTATLGKLLRDVCDYIVLLSATPVHLKSQDLYQLLNLIDEDTFNLPGVFDQILLANEPLIKARDSVLAKRLSQAEFIKIIQNALAHPLLKANRQLSSFISNPPTTEELSQPQVRGEIAGKLDVINILGFVINRTRKRDVSEWQVTREPYPEEISLTEPEREFYVNVTEMVREFCVKNAYHEGFLLVLPQRQMCSSMPAALREWKRKKADYGEMLYEDLGIEEEIKIGPLTREVISKVDKLGDLDQLWNNDSKFNRVLEVIQNVLKKNVNEKIVLFSYFRPTIDYLYERLTEKGVFCITLMGGIKTNKTKIQEEFASPSGPNILLSTEVGSEGIDLQFSSMLINYDLPWNPMKVEQRIGRIDRLGQKSKKVIIWNLFYKDTIDSRIYFRLYERLKIFERALGGLEPILGEEISKLTIELLTKKLTPEQEEQRIEKRAQALENNRQAEEKLEEEAAHLVAYGDYILNQVKAARQLNRWITGKDIQTYVLEFFELYYSNSVFHKISPNQNVFSVTLSNEAKHDLEEFIKTNKIQTNTLLVKSDPAPVRCLFENKIAINEPSRTDIINQSHPLVRFVSYELGLRNDRNHPAVAVELDSSHADGFDRGIYVFTIQKWSVKGLQDLERLFFSALDDDSRLLIDENAERLIVTASSFGRNWLEAKNEVDEGRAAQLANEHCLEYSDKKYAEYILDITNKNEDRADIQIKTLDSHLRNQLKNLEAVRLKHEMQGRASLAKATQGKIDKLRSRVDRQKLEINSKRKINYSKEEICIGLIKVF